MAQEILKLHHVNTETDTVIYSTYAPRHYLTATTDPGVNDDETQYYFPSSFWKNTTNNKLFICKSNADGAAVWEEHVAGGTGPAGADGSPGISGGMTFPYDFVDTVTSGGMKPNNASFASVTSLQVHSSYLEGHDIGAFVNTFGSGDSLRIFNSTTGGHGLYTIGSVTDNSPSTDIITIALTHISSSGSWEDGQSGYVSFGERGPTGAPGTPGTDGTDGTDGADGTNGIDGIMIPGGRLTLTSGTPVAFNAPTATSLFYTPYTSNRITLWDGSAWTARTFTEQSITISTGFSVDTVADVFAYWDTGTSSVKIERVSWSSLSARATAITLQDGRYCLSGDKTRLYLGTVYRDNTQGMRVDTLYCYVWNMYNRVETSLVFQPNDNSHTYTTASFRAWNNQSGQGSRLERVCGLNDDAIAITAEGLAASSSAVATIGIGIDITTTDYSLSRLAMAVNAIHPRFATYRGRPDNLGLNRFYLLENGGTGCTFYGNNGAAAKQQSALIASIRF